MLISSVITTKNVDYLIQKSATYNTGTKIWSVRFGNNTVFDRDLLEAIKKLLKILGEKK